MTHRTCSEELVMESSVYNRPNFVKGSSPGSVASSRHARITTGCDVTSVECGWLLSSTTWSGHGLRSAHPSKPMRRAAHPTPVTKRSLAARVLRAHFRATADRPACPDEVTPVHGSSKPPGFDHFQRKFGTFFGRIHDSRPCGAQPVGPYRSHSAHDAGEPAR